MIKLKKFWNCEWRKNNCLWIKFRKFPNEIILPSVLKYLRHPWCKWLKETKLGSPSSSRLPACAMVPNLSTTWISTHSAAGLKLADMSVPGTCRLPLPQEGTWRPGVLQLCGSLDGSSALGLQALVACISQHGFKWTSRTAELFGWNSLKMAWVLYSSLLTKWLLFSL